MPRRKNATTADAAVVENENVTENENVSQEAEEAAERDQNTPDAEFAEDGDQSDMFYGRFVVPAKLIENADAREFHGSENVDFLVTRWKVRSYTARCIVGTGDDATAYKGGVARNPSKAIKNAIGAMSGKVKEYTFDAESAEKEQAPIPEKAGDNQPEEAFLYTDTTTEIGQALAAIVVRLEQVEKLYTEADTNTRAAERGIGSAYNDARDAYRAAGINVEGETKSGNAEWGAWLKARFRHLPHVYPVMAHPTKRSRYGRYASAPDAVVNAMPTVNTASTFNRKMDEAVSGNPLAKDRPGFAPAIIEGLYATAASDSDNPEVPDTRALWDAAAMRHADNLESVAKSKTAWEAAVAVAIEEGNAPPEWADKQQHVDNLIIDWLLGDVSPSDEATREERAAAFAGTKIHKAMLAAWEEEVTANRPKTDEEQEAANTATKEATKKAAKEQAKGIALMTVTEAAEVVANTIMAHGEPAEIVEALREVIKSRLEANAAKAAADKAKAEEEANAA